MSVFGSYLNEETNNEYIEEEATFSEIQEMAFQSITKDDYISMLEDIIAIETADEDDVVEEGANLDMRERFNSFKKEFKAENKVLRKALRAKDKAQAKTSIEKMRSILSAAEKDIKSIKGDEAGSIVLGYFAGALQEWAEILVPTFNYYGAHSSSSHKALDIVGGVFALPLKTLIIVIKQITTFVDELKKDIQASKNGEGISAQSFNRYRNNIIRYLHEFDKNLQALEKQVDKLEG